MRPTSCWELIACVALSVAALAGLVACPHADVEINATDFEKSGGYPEGDLNGRLGWEADTAPQDCVVQSAPSSSGSWAARVTADGRYAPEVFDTVAYHGFSDAAGSSSQVALTLDFKITSANEADDGVISAEEGASVPAIVLFHHDKPIYISDDDTGFQWDVDEWKQLKPALDFDRGRFDVLYGGLLVAGDVEFSDAASGVDAFGIIADDYVAEGSVFSFDNLRIVGNGPSITDLAPTSGPQCSYVRITGTDFGAGAGSVSFDGVAGSVVSWSDTQVYCRAPSGATTGDVVVHPTEGPHSNAVSFTVTTPSIIHVSNTTNVPGIENGTVAYPFSTVQRGIDAASDGAEVVVAGGTYVENVNFSGKAITVRSTDPDDPSIVAATIIDGNQNDSVVTFSSGEGPGSVLEGFTLQNGLDVCGGGVYCRGSSPTIMKNVVTGNTAYRDYGPGGEGYGGGIYCGRTCSPVIRNNVICGNTAGGTGLWSYGCGGGILLEMGVSAVLESNTIVGNSAVGEASTGGGVSCVWGGQVSIKDCIIWSNVAGDGPEVALLGDPWSDPTSLTVQYSNVRLGEVGISLDDAQSCTLTWGDGNIDVDPRFANPSINDYHLKSQAGRRDPAGGWVTDGVTSPCVDAGDPASDYASEPLPNGSRINMGAYGNTAQASKSVPDPEVASAMPPSGPITTYMKIQGSWFGVAEGTVEIGGTDARILSWTDTEIRCRVEPGTTSGVVVVRRLNGVESNPVPFTVTSPEIVYVDDDNTSGIENGTQTWPFSKVQRGVDAAVETATIHTVIAARGTYAENVDFRGEDITVRSTDPDDPAVVADTIIDGNQTGSTVTFNSGEGADSILTGFTIRGGSGTDHYGGGVHCDGTSPVIEKNRIVGNTVHFHGGGVYCKGGSPTIRNNVIATNVARWFGAGIVSWDSTATLSRNTIHGNAAHWYGGGIFAHGPAAPTIKNNVVYGNTGSEGAGIACIYQCSPLVENNTVAANAAERAGGGVYAAWDCSPVLKNMIVWGNTAPGGSQIALAEESSSEITYSDVQGGEALVSVGSGCALTWGDGNVDLLPLFASSTDFHLLSIGGRYLPSSGLPPEDPAAWLTDAEHSPCIDTGDPTSVYAEELAPHGSRINMGAYGNTIQASKSGEAAPLAVRFLRGTEDAPRLVATIPELGSRPYSLKRLTLTFDRAVKVGAGAVEVYGWQTGAHPDYRLTYDAAGQTVHLQWPTSLPDDTYEVRLMADAILSVDGSMPLDGEVDDPADPESLPSGNGIPGGDARIEFEVTPRSLPKPPRSR